MSFEYRELSTQVFLNAGGGGNQGGDDQGDDNQADCCGNTCGTTTIEFPTDNCGDQGDQGDQGGNRKALSLLRQQLRDTLAAG